ncbi:MAG: hypothetical protein J6K37_00680 [Lachnospiraceae bacterium]|nr:hypothetical protein [Lachnospiraceae bacterium]
MLNKNCMTSKNKLMLWILKHLVVFIVGSILYIISFHIPLLDITGIYFYDGIIRLFFVFFFVMVIELLNKEKLFHDDYKDVLLSLAIFGLVNLLWLSLCVVSLDRSVSVFLLCYMDEVEKQGEQYISEETIEECFEQVFIEKYDMLGRRYDEQLASGNIAYDAQGNLYLTDNGKRIVEIFRIVGELYNTDKRFIYPGYVR